MKGRYEKQRSKRKPNLISILKGIILSFFSLVLILVAAVSLYYNMMLNKINHVDVPEIVYTTSVDNSENIMEEPASPTSTLDAITISTEPHIPSRNDYINFLLVGQASREGEEARFADTMILCTVNKYEKTVTLTSLLRDSLIQMPDYKGHTGGKIKLTTIYHLGSLYGNGIAGSMEMMNLTLYNNFGIEVDHNFEIDFDAFINIIDILGGIDIEITEAEANYLNKEDGWVQTDVTPGLAHFDGMTALCYARMRKASGDGDSDITRTKRQRMLISALLEKLQCLTIVELQSLVEEVLPLVATSMNNAEITDIILTLLPLLPDLTIKASGTCPASYYGDMVEIYSDGVYHSVLRFNEQETKATMRTLTKGENQ